MLHPGLRLRSGRYRLLSLVRAGATAQVWRALDVKDGTEVAVKAVPDDAGGAAAVEHEAEAVARVKHPGAVRVHATFEEAGYGLIVMELAACSLADHVEAHGPLDAATTRGVALALAEVLAAAHAAGVVHRDVKPQNVLVMQDGSVRLADFGIARVHAQGHTRTRALLGTLPFMAPEQRRDARDVRPATDAYALAALTAWMRTGSPPGDLFVPGVIAALRGSLRAAGEPDDALLDVLVAAGTHDPGERTRDGAAFAEALRGIGASLEAARVGGVGVEGGTFAATGAAPPSGADDLPTLAAHDPYQPNRGGVPTPPPGWSGRWVGVAGAGGLVADRAGDSGGGGPRPPATPPGASPSGKGSAWRWGIAAFSAGAALGLGVLALRGGLKEVVEQGAVPAEDGIAQVAALASLPRCDDYVARWLEHAHPAPRESMHPVVADIDGDKVSDVAYSNQGDASVSIWWGVRGAMPSMESRLEVGRTGLPIAVGDVTSDGMPDLVTYREDTSAFEVWRGKGGRTFDRAEAVPHANIQAFSLFDWDTDGDLDLLFNEAGLPWMGVRAREAAAWRPGQPAVFGTLLGVSAEVGSPRVVLRREDGSVRSLRTTLGGRDEQLLVAAQDPLSHAFYLGSWLSSTGAGRTTFWGWMHLIARRDEATGKACLWTTSSGPNGGLRIGDLDGDGRLELADSRTCAGCTSAQVFSVADGPALP